MSNNLVQRIYFRNEKLIFLRVVLVKLTGSMILFKTSKIEPECNTLTFMLCYARESKNDILDCNFKINLFLKMCF